MNEVASSVATLKISSVQAVALAFVTYYLGVWIKSKVALLQKLSLPAAVIGGLPFAFFLSVLRGLGILQVTFDNSLSTVALLAFFTTVGMMASLKLVKYGGIALVFFWIISTIVGFAQNLIGMGIAGAMGIDPHYGILAGAVSLMGGLGTSAAFGPYFETTYGIQGSTSVAITAATFGMVAALVLGGPFGEWILNKYNIDPANKPAGADKPDAVDLTVLEEEENSDARGVIKASAFVFLAIGIGSVVSAYLGQLITLPAYIGAMLIAAVIRNIGDFSGMYKVQGGGLNIVAEVALTVYVTMAINSLNLYELIHLALPLFIILVAQTVFMLVVAWLVYFRIFGKNYESMMLAVGAIGFAMGATANGLANMQAIGDKHGHAPRAWLIVSLVGAFLIDFTNAIIITWMGAW
ncbi:sodium/glutamate symporter [Veillonella sp.]|uniref:sodium/glutamate symporter n=1 Tax=Veillonella sp. TaxID=1926307 RepID=UPI001B4249BC|nr:sodium/glutamate symporter [Veillonella sp.]MBP8616367.1 sodium:glutamate symporter [Veillonella sp.]MBP9517603.1 sodium:glutamate symporter [Veillonella sp.]MBP9550826.1 sodium:glutamate symporter [Veillonella sp.]